MTEKERILQSGLLEQYILGLTSEEETLEVERSAEKYPEIQSEINSMRSCLESYTRKHAIPPPRELKGQILKNIGDLEAKNSGKEARRIKRRKTSAWFSATAIAGLLLLSFFLFLKQNELQNDYSSLMMKMERYEQEYKPSLSKLADMQSQFVILEDLQTTHIYLTGSGEITDVLVAVYWNVKNEEAIIQIVNLPDPPPGKQYQVWADMEGKMINMGLLKCRKNVLQPLKFIKNAKSLNITIEPKGGSEHPTVEKLCAIGKII